MTNMTNKCYVIPVRYQCSADCPFCITKAYAPLDAREALRPDTVFENSLAQVADRATFEVTGGGEPTLNPHLGSIIARVRAVAGNPFVKLYTNGAHLAKIYGVDELNVSRMAAADDENARAMRFRKRPPALRTIVAHWRTLGVKRIRLSVALTRNWIDSPDKLSAFIADTSPFVDSYVVRPLYPGSPLMKSLYVEPFNDFDDDRVQFDLESCALRPNVILASDGRLYKDFALTHAL